jgi:aminoglycoside 6'-N-acetyltransferase I
LAERSPGRVVGFAEVDLRARADGCRTRPVGYMEGWYVVPEERRRGVGRALFRAAEEWARKQGCTEMASDTMVGNELGESAHKALGYEEVDRLILFRKNL